jgi:RecB family exonuclease
VVLVPNARVAHGLRREGARAGKLDTLAGTYFLPLVVAALGVLESAGIACRPGEEERRRSRLIGLFGESLGLAYFPLDLLRETPGWEDAFARTIGDLEAAGLRPSDLPTRGAIPRLGDVRLLWEALDALARDSWTRGRILREAATALEKSPSLWSYDGPVLAAVGSDLTEAEACFARAIPSVSVVILAARPLREHHLQRIGTLLSVEAVESLRQSAAPRRSSSERDLLASYLFEPPSLLAAPERPRSDGPDGTVDLEEHSGVEEELEAAADWVARQVLGRGIPLEEIAVLIPRLDPLAAMVSDRLARFPWRDGAMPVYVAGGVLLSTRAAGARALAVIRALRAHLDAESLADVLPVLRASGDGVARLSRGAAMDLAFSLGTLGGNPADPRGGLEWAPRAAERDGEIEALLSRAREAGDDAEQAGLARKAPELERLLDNLRAIRPALEALVSVALVVIDRSSLAEIWKALHAFFGDWLLSPGEGVPAQALIHQALEGLVNDAASARLRGEDALRVIEGVASAVRVPVGRFGDPAVYVGTVWGAAGLSFRAVRVIGLHEGSIPSLPHEDPVLPDSTRTGLSQALPRTEDRALSEIHALDRVIRDAREVVALSCPRRDLNGTEHEPASIFLEAAAAIARPNAVSGKRGEGTVPNIAALRRDYFGPARASTERFRKESPLSAATWQDQVASGAVNIPSGWSGKPIVDLERLRALVNVAGPTADEGFFADPGLLPRIPGLTREHPISASSLQTLLRCPHQFLYERVLYWKEPAAAPSRREIDAMPYGSLFHRVAEEFYRKHGARFGRRESTLDRWLAEGDTIAERAFTEFLHQYPLAGASVRAQQRERLRRDLRSFLEYDWAGGKPRKFVAAEIPFGKPDPAEIVLPEGTLYVHGFIDRIDVEGSRMLIRDLKTGRSHPRRGDETEPDPVMDIQIALYGIAARGLAVGLDAPEKVAAAYAYVDGRGDPERSFRDDFAALENEARTWLSAVVSLLRNRVFPRTPNRDDCQYCVYRAACGPDANDRAALVLRQAGAAVSGFALMKQEGE